MTKYSVYLDHAAATPLDDDVFAAMQPYLTKQFYNPSALYLASKDVHGALSGARETVAKVLGARPSEVVFTAGGTEANNLAIQGVMEQFPGGNVVVSAIEHDSVLEPAKQFDHKIAPVKPSGHTDISQLARFVDDQTVLVSVMYANNETGAVQPMTGIAKLVQKIRAERRAAGNQTPLYLHTDACQAANYLPLQVSRLGVDMMTLNGSKIYGPKQSGCLYVKAGIKLSPQILGGGQERGLRSGTENVPGIIGFARALQKAANLHDKERERLSKLRSMFLQGLGETPAVVTIGSGSVLPNFVHMRLPDTDNERIIMELDERGIMAAAGSACSASNDEPSHVLLAMGLSEAEAQSSIRFSMGRGTTSDDIDRTLQALADIDRLVYTDA